MSVNESLRFLETEKIELVILDGRLQELNGWITCQKIREFSDVPIIMATDRSKIANVKKGLQFGANDYIIKPFQEEELLSRIEVLLDRSNQKGTNLFLSGLNWNQEAMELKYQHQSIILTPKEFALMGLFLKNPQKVLSRDRLLNDIWGVNKNKDKRTVDSHIRNIRDKLRNGGFPIDQHLLTVWGIGYKWVIDKEPKLE